MSETTEILKAGGLVPLNAKLGKDDAVDNVVARAYSHGVLPGRVVIRLTAQSVVAGDDLEMTTLGFGAGDDRGPVAKERRRPLGFPGWALVNDPKNARFALDVVKEFKKHARKAKSKPGHAKDGIDAIALKLGKSVPHFLPSFYEEAGRAFIEHGATTFAAAFFGKAREAEAVHALDVDEDHRVHGFLEFALAGAVTTKALAQYSKDLGDHHKPDVAYAHFRQLCLQRTLGGMPPWSGMAKELRRLAKAAKLDPDKEDAQFIAEIIESPALGKAAGEFWRAYLEPITALGKENPAARGALLNLFPTGSSYNADLDEVWLDLLDATGAIDALTGNDAPAQAQPSAGRAAWFDKLTQHLSRSYRNSTISKRAFDLLRRIAPMLVADGKPITCAGRYGRIDLDLCELALELGVPVALSEHPRLDVEEWAKHATEPDRGRDPVRAAAHPTIGPLVAYSVASEIGSEPFDTMSRNKAGFLAAKRAFVEGSIAKAESGALPQVIEALNTISNKVKAETFAELPDLHARLAAVEIAPALGRTLRVGIIDELGWPLLEDLVAELNPDGKVDLTYHGAPQALVVATKTRAVAVDATKRLGEHDFVIPAKQEVITVRFIGGQFLVVLKQGYKACAYWSSAPHDVFEVEGISTWSVPTLANRAAVFADGAWLESETPMRPGERKLSLGSGVTAFDGTTAWVGENKDGVYRWREVSSTGEQGRYSWPSFIEAMLETDWKVDDESFYMPAPKADSPLGVRDGFVGVRVRFQQGDQSNRWTQTKREIETIDGMKWTGEVNAHMCALVRLPGGGDPRPVLADSVWREGVVTTLLSPDGKVHGSKINSELRYAKGQATSIGPSFWHMMSPRDEVGSKRLHAVTDDDARRLIAAVPVQKTTPPGVAHPEPTDVTAGILDAVSHPRLKRGITGIAILAAEQQLERDRLVAERAPGQAAKPTSVGGHNDDVLIAALTGFCERHWSKEGRAWGQIERAGDIFKSEDRSDRTLNKLPGATLDWFDYAIAPGSLVFMALAVGTPADKRKPVAELLQHITTSLPAPDKLRIFTATMPKAENEDDDDDDDDLAPFELRWVAGNAYAIKKVGWQGTEIRVLEYAPDGTFRTLPNWIIEKQSPGTRAVAADQIEQLFAAIADGKTSWSADVAAKLEGAGLTPSEAVYLWAGCPGATERTANFLDKELREKVLGLKAKQAEVARDGMYGIPVEKRVRAVDAPGQAGVAALLDGSAADALVASWKSIFGARVAIPEELIAEADRELWAPLQPKPALELIGNADSVPELTVDANWGLDEACDVVRVANPEPIVQAKLPEVAPAFDIRALQTVLIYLPFVFAELPVGHALRASAGRAHELVLQRLANKALWFQLGSQYMSEEEAKAMDRVLDGLGGEMLTGFSEGITGRRLPGAVIQRSGNHAEIKLHPASLDAKAVSMISKIATTINQWGLSAWKAVEVARSADYAAFGERIKKTPVPEGKWEQNPLVSAPKLVDKVAKEHGVSKDAAALYLQYLVLLWPTPKNVQLWNDWKPKQFDAANEELVDKELVLEAKRERAQRGHFLPGGWDALKSPNPPMESWKMPLYGTRSAEGDPVPPLVRFQALAPFHLLFERAWKRCEDGDTPRYEEVKR